MAWCASADRAAEGVDHVFLVQQRLAGAWITGIKVALEVALIDLRDLEGEGGHAVLLVVHAGQVEQDSRYALPLFADDLFGRRLRAGIGPFRGYGLAFHRCDDLARSPDGSAWCRR